MAREALNLINEELKHRVKNTLAGLGAVAAQTFRDASSRTGLEKYQARLDTPAGFGTCEALMNPLSASDVFLTVATTSLAFLTEIALFILIGMI